MIKIAVLFLVGLGLGYSYGYRQAAAGRPSIMERVMVSFGVYKVQADQQRRERAAESVR
jgi:hypothetical protein